MAVFALTGNPSSGKSTVLALLKDRGVRIFDADRMVHKYYNDFSSNIYKEIACMFPEVIEKGRISRKKLGEIVFSSPEHLKELERIVHPVITRDLKKWINKARVRKGIFVAEIPLLFERKLEKCFDGVILVVVSRKIIIRRIINKFCLAYKDAVKRLSFYSPIKDKIKKSNFIIYNNDTVNELKKEVILLWDKLKKVV